MIRMIENHRAKMDEMAEKLSRRPRMLDLVSRCDVLYEKASYHMQALVPPIVELRADIVAHVDFVEENGDVGIDVPWPDLSAERDFVEAIDRAMVAGGLQFLQGELPALKSRVMERVEATVAEVKAQRRPPLLSWFTEQVELKERLVGDWQVNGWRDIGNVIEFWPTTEPLLPSMGEAR